jgi:hypothetical protein
MGAKAFRLWATERLVLWPNRLHLLLIVLVIPLVASHVTWFGLLLVSCLIGSLVFRVWWWDQRRLRERSASAMP